MLTLAAFPACPRAAPRSAQYGGSGACVGSGVVAGVLEDYLMPRDNTNQVLHRAFDLLGVIATYRGQWFHLEDIALKAGLPKSTTWRLLQFFVERGILERNELVAGAYRHKRAEQK